MENDKLKPFERKSLRLSWVNLILSLLVGVVFFYQFREMRKQTDVLSTQAKQAAADSIDAGKRVERQLDIAKQQATAGDNSVAAITKQMRQDLRPWVEVGCEVDCKHVILAENQPLGMFMRLTNTGKTPAENVVADFVVEKLKNEDHPRLVYSKANPPHVTVLFGHLFPNRSNTRFAVYKLLPKTKTSEPELLTHTDIEDLTSDKFYWAIYGKVIYTDVFGVSHWTKFCTWNTEYQGPETIRMSAQKCTKYNSVDNN